MKWLLLFLLSHLTVVHSTCFKNQSAPYRRVPYGKAWKVMDFYYCKISCTESPGCLAFAFDEKLSVCAPLGGPATTLSCTLPTQEWLRFEAAADCPIIPQFPIDKLHVRNPKIPGAPAFFHPAIDSAIPCGAGAKVMDVYVYYGSHLTGQNDFTTKISFDDRLAAWQWSQNGQAPRYIRSAQCYEPNLSDPAVTNVTLCYPLGGAYIPGSGTGFSGVPVYGQANPCPVDFPWVRYMPSRAVSDLPWTNAVDFYKYAMCLYGEWFFIGPLDGVTQASEFSLASCVNF